MHHEDEDKITKEEIVHVCRNIDNSGIEIRETDKNLEFMEKFDLIQDDLKDYIHEIEIIDYRDGPLTDDKPAYKHPLWVFIKQLGDIRVTVYIKLKTINHRKKIIVYSFHQEGLHG